MKFFRKILLANVCMIMIFGLMGCGAKTEEKVVRIGFFPNITHGQALVMKDMQTMENNLSDYEVRYTTFNAGPAEVEALFAGALDIAYIGPVPAISANVKSWGDVRVISNGSNAGAVLVKRSGEEINSVADLDGKTVAIPQLGNTQHLCLLNLLTEHGLAPVSEGGTVEVVAVANADVQLMMEQKNVDAALVPEPWGSILELQGGAEVVLDYTDIMLDGNYPVAVIVIHEDFAKEHPDVVAQFLVAHEEATNFINTSKEEAATIFNRQLEELTGKTLDENVISSAMSRLSYTTEVSKDALDIFAQISLEEGFVSELPDETLMHEE